MRSDENRKILEFQVLMMFQINTSRKSDNDLLKAKLVFSFVLNKLKKSQEISLSQYDTYLFPNPCIEIRIIINKENFCRMSNMSE